MILCGDIGGTKTRIAWFQQSDGRLKEIVVEQYASANFSHLKQIIDAFLHKHPGKVTTACFGVPGPVMNGEVMLTNLSWKISESDLQLLLGTEKVLLVNDLAATAAAIPHFPADFLEILYSGEEQSSARRYAVLAPGTGLGQAYLLADQQPPVVLPSEGGHIEFAPQDDLQIELLRFLQKKYDHVSYERVISGPGLVNIFQFLAEYHGENPELLSHKESDTGDPAAAIASAAQSGQNAIARQALELFAAILGTVAGNMVLNILATGGVYLGGGIPPRIRWILKEDGFLNGYFHKGRLSYVLKKTPVYLIKDDRAALLGTAALGAQLGSV